MDEDELAFANELADRAGAIGLSYFCGSFEVHEKADRTPVTEADLAIEAAIREAVRERYPSDGVQIWANLIALEVDGEPVVGVANLPALGERYEAARRNGARLNGGPIRVSRADRVPRAFCRRTGSSTTRS